jgi:hypothetical protein
MPIGASSRPSVVDGAPAGLPLWTALVRLARTSDPAPAVSAQFMLLSRVGVILAAMAQLAAAWPATTPLPRTAHPAAAEATCRLA